MAVSSKKCRLSPGDDINKIYVRWAKQTHIWLFNKSRKGIKQVVV